MGTNCAPALAVMTDWRGVKSKSPATPASFAEAAAQPNAQADAGLRFGSVARLSRRAA